MERTASESFTISGFTFETWLSMRGYRRRPDYFAEDLAVEIKRAAKYLARGASISRAQAFEALAIGGKFSNWHHLSTHLKHPGVSPLQACGIEWFQALFPLRPLLGCAAPEMAPDLEARSAVELLCGRVANSISVPKELVLDCVAAQMAGERTWAQFLSRTPIEAKEPFYQFRVGSDGAGAFVESAPCQALVEELDEQWQGYSEFKKQEKQSARAWVEACTRRRPDFLEAGLALAQMKDYAEELESLTEIKQWVVRAEALIPTSFKGTIPWSDVANRFYHRMLWLQMSIEHRESDMRAAAHTARKMLKFNPGDNLGVRDYLPLICLSGHDYLAARRATKHFAKESGYHLDAVRAFVAFANGDKAAFRKHLLASLFSLPILRSILLASTQPLPDGDEGYRGVIPDLKTLYDFMWEAYTSVPGLTEASCKVLRESGVKAAEGHLRSLWYGFWRKPNQSATNSREDWSRAKKEYIEVLTREAE